MHIESKRTLLIHTVFISFLVNEECLYTWKSYTFMKFEITVSFIVITAINVSY